VLEQTLGLAVNSLSHPTAARCQAGSVRLAPDTSSRSSPALSSQTLHTPRPLLVLFPSPPKQKQAQQAQAEGKKKEKKDEVRHV
jgi:hypothetical protein